MRLLSSLAWADGVVDDDELEVLHLAANDLSVALSERDMEEHDLDALASKIRDPELRTKLLGELVRLAASDDCLADEELAQIKYLAGLFELAPPPIEGIDWDTV